MDLYEVMRTTAAVREFTDDLAALAVAATGCESGVLENGVEHLVR